MTPDRAKLDPLDRRIIAALQMDGRASWTEIADACGTSVATVARRAQQLLAEGVVRVAVIAPDINHAGPANLFVVRIKCAAGEQVRVAEELLSRSRAAEQHRCWSAACPSPVSGDERAMVGGDHAVGPRWSDDVRWPWSGWMPEGLSPIEAGKELHKHSQEPDEELAPTGAHRHARTVQIGEALLLSLVTIAAAWSGYAAARWGTASRIEIARSATLRNLATRADLSALSTRNFDSSTFSAWFIAFTLSNPQKQAIAQRRFRPEFKVAFDAWMATDPMHNPHAAPGPTYMPQYRLADQVKADALDRRAEAALAAGDHAGVVGDDYIRITVFLAAVLFLVGIGSTFKLLKIRYALLTLGSTLLILATVLIVRQPGLPD